MNYFKGKIKCMNCGKNFKFKMLRNNPCYICSGFANYGKEFCTSYFIEENELIEVVKRHLSINKTYINKPILDYVEIIKVEGEGYRVLYIDGGESLMNVPNEYGLLCIRY